MDSFNSSRNGYEFGASRHFWLSVTVKHTCYYVQMEVRGNAKIWLLLVTFAFHCSLDWIEGSWFVMYYRHRHHLHHYPAIYAFTHILKNIYCSRLLAFQFSPFHQLSIKIKHIILQTRLSDDYPFLLIYFIQLFFCLISFFL